MIFAVRPGRPTEARGLLERSHDLMRSLFPPESNHFLGIAALEEPSIRFFVADSDGSIVGCGALAVRNGYGEIKSMFTEETCRGRGVADAILRAVEGAARAEELPILRLETGDKLRAAQRLYRRHGFKDRAPFGDYVEDPNSLFMEKTLRCTC